MARLAAARPAPEGERSWIRPSPKWWEEPPIGAFVDVSTGEQYACGVQADGTARCWGSDHAGETQALEGSFSAISAGLQHACGLRPDGSIECWGDNTDERLVVPEIGG